MKSTIVACLIASVFTAATYGPGQRNRCRPAYRAYMQAEPNDNKPYPYYTSDPFMTPMPTEIMPQAQIMFISPPAQPLSHEFNFDPLPTASISQPFMQDQFQPATANPTPTRVITQMPQNRPRIQSTYRLPPREKPTTVPEEDPFFE
ncbi:hypothetical protein DSO57_1038148 [Entomophthora muscae]|uniref:Uncharacterized protein n=1 Tax=Entomophthora muscae TaxID=34485 RepID=A0ACC2RPR3_9FUNG|nr:hypothetical protein DSO57_1038148 [Entomophthora muscae]